MGAPPSKHLVRSTASIKRTGPWKDPMQQAGEEILTEMWNKPTKSRMGSLKSPENTARSRERGVQMKEDLA